MVVDMGKLLKDLLFFKLSRTLMSSEWVGWGGRWIYIVCWGQEKAEQKKYMKLFNLMDLLPSDPQLWSVDMAKWPRKKIQVAEMSFLCGFKDSARSSIILQSGCLSALKGVSWGALEHLIRISSRGLPRGDIPPWGRPRTCRKDYISLLASRWMEGFCRTWRYVEEVM